MENFALIFLYIVVMGMYIIVIIKFRYPFEPCTDDSNCQFDYVDNNKLFNKIKITNLSDYLLLW